MCPPTERAQSNHNAVLYSHRNGRTSFSKFADQMKNGFNFLNFKKSTFHINI